MRTARFPSYVGGQSSPLRTQTRLDADPPPGAGHVTCDACWEANTPLWTEWQTRVKALLSRNSIGWR